MHVCDHAPVCVSFQSVHASVPLIILIWLCLLLACLVGDKAEGLSLSHTRSVIIRLAGQRGARRNFHVHSQSAYRKGSEQKALRGGDEQGTGWMRHSIWVNKVQTEREQRNMEEDHPLKSEKNLIWKTKYKKSAGRVTFTLA